MTSQQYVYEALSLKKNYPTRIYLSASQILFGNIGKSH